MNLIPASGKDEGRKTFVCTFILLPLYQLVTSSAARSLLRRLILRLEGGPVFSLTIRVIFRKFHGVDVGLYTIGPCEVAPGNLAPGTAVGRYSSVYYTVKTIACDPLVGAEPSPIALPVSALTKAVSGNIQRIKLEIGNDVWIGHNVIILPSVGQIGDGAIIGAGSVVQADVPPYAVVTGNPARVVRYRFSGDKIKELLASKWWLKTIDELRCSIGDFQKPLEGDTVR